MQFYLDTHTLKIAKRAIVFFLFFFFFFFLRKKARPRGAATGSPDKQVYFRCEVSGGGMFVSCGKRGEIRVRFSNFSRFIYLKKEEKEKEINFPDLIFCLFKPITSSFVLFSAAPNYLSRQPETIKVSMPSEDCDFH